MSERTRRYYEAGAEGRNTWPDPVSEPNYYDDRNFADPDIGAFELDESPIARKTIVSHPATGQLVQLDHGVMSAEYFHHSIHKALGKRGPVVQRGERNMLEERTYGR